MKFVVFTKPQYDPIIITKKAETKFRRKYALDGWTREEFDGPLTIGLSFYGRPFVHSWFPEF